MNQPPIVTWPPDSTAGEITWPVLADPTSVRVVAFDPEGDNLLFVWNIPRATEEPETDLYRHENGDWVNVVRIPKEWLRDGDTFDLSISDEANRRNVVLLQFRAEVPE